MRAYLVVVLPPPLDHTPATLFKSSALRARDLLSWLGWHNNRTPILDINQS